MFKNIFGLAILCCVFNLAKAEYVRAKTSSIKKHNVDLKNEIDFQLIISPEFSKLVNVLSPNSKTELEVFIDKAKGLLFDNDELLALVEKNYNLYNSYKDFVHRKPKINFILSVGEENPFELDPNNADKNVLPNTIENFEHSLSHDELKQLEDAKLEFEAILLSKSEPFFAEMEKSNLNKELKEKSGNKMFKASAIFS